MFCCCKGTIWYAVLTDLQVKARLLLVGSNPLFPTNHHEVKIFKDLKPGLTQGGCPSGSQGKRNQGSIEAKQIKHSVVGKGGCWNGFTRELRAFQL